MKPNKEAIQEWVDAFRSGDYEQGYGQLKYGDKYCCLGVAENLNGPIDKTYASGLDEENCEYYFNDPNFKGEVPVKYRGETVLLTSLNDGLDGYESHSFDQIANIIEQNFLNDE